MVQGFQSTFTWPSHLEPVAALLSRWECVAEEPSAFHDSQEARRTKVMYPHHGHAHLLWPGLLPLKPLCRISTALSYHRLGMTPLTQQPLEDIEDANSRRPSAFPAMDATACVLAPGSKLGRDSPALKTVHLWLCPPGAYCHWTAAGLAPLQPQGFTQMPSAKRSCSWLSCDFLSWLPTQSPSTLGCSQQRSHRIQLKFESSNVLTSATITFTVWPTALKMAHIWKDTLCS